MPSASRNTSKFVNAAICAELPDHLKKAIAFFGFSGDCFRISSPAEIKKTRLLLSAEKDRKEKQIQREKEIDKLLHLLADAEPSHQEQGAEGNEDLGAKNLKQLKALSMTLCKKHYSSLYGHLQKLK